MNFTNITFDEYDEDPIASVALTFLSILIVLGIFLNLWQLGAIVTLADMRLRMRNKLIVSTCVLHLTECCLKMPMCLVFLLDHLTSCILTTLYFNIILIQDFVCNWILVEMIALFLCQTMDLNISERLSILGQRIVTVSVLFSPWVVASFIVPAIYFSTQSENLNCFLPNSFQILTSIDSVVPLLLSIILLVVAIVKKRSRYRKGFSASNMQVELISRGPELDETSAYVVAIAVSILCDIGIVVEDLKLVEHTSIPHFLLFASLESSRVIFMMLPWLLFKDVRTRMKTWRPWYRSSSGSDLTLTYRKGQEDA